MRVSGVRHECDGQYVGLSWWTAVHLLGSHVCLQFCTHASLLSLIASLLFLTVSFSLSELAVPFRSQKHCSFQEAIAVSVGVTKYM